MRARLLEATVELPGRARLRRHVDDAGLRAGGVSRGAQLHHFPTKNDLVVAAVEHLTEVRGAELAAAAGDAADGRDGVPARCSQMLGDHFASPVFTAALELWVAARTDAGAARRRRAARAAGRPRDAPADRRAARRRRVAARRARAGAGDPRPGPRARAGRHDHRRRPPARAGSSTSGPRTLDDRAGGAGMTDLLDGLLADLKAEGDRLARDRRRLGDGRLGDADPGARAGPSPPRSPTCSGPTRWPSSPRTRTRPRQGGVGRRRARRRSPTRRATSTRAPSRSPGCRATRCSTRWGAAGAALRATLARAARRARRCRGSARRCRPASMATARFMETWAHALDVYDARSASQPEPTDRIRHVAHLGVRTRNFAYSRARARTPPAEEFRVELTAPSRRRCGRGGPRTPRRRVTGSAYDFCLLVTQRRAPRRHRPGRRPAPTPSTWLTIAQAFAGPPGEGGRPTA